MKRDKITPVEELNGSSSNPVKDEDEKHIYFNFRMIGLIVLLVITILVAVLITVQTTAKEDAINKTISPSPSNLPYITLPKTVSDNMVLQRQPKLAKLFGYYFNNKLKCCKIKIYLETSTGAKYNANVSVDQTSNKWFAIFKKPIPANIGCKIIIIACKLSGNQNNDNDICEQEMERKTLLNIAIGDVYICSGQSNMEMTMESSENGYADIVESYKPEYENLRLIIPGALKNVYHSTQQDNYQTMVSGWNRPSVSNMAGGNCKDFNDATKWNKASAICYRFGLKQYNEMNRQVPVGIVHLAYGGQRIALFLAPSDNQICQTPNCGNSNTACSGLYNGLLSPFRFFSIKSILFYQGESDVSNGYTYYVCALKKLVSRFRTLYDDPYLQIFNVLLSPYNYNSGPKEALPALRRAQIKALENDRNATTTSCLDLGDPVSLCLGSTNNHPTKKSEIANRLFQCSKNRLDGNIEAPCEGPLPFSCKYNSSMISIVFNKNLNIKKDIAACPATTNTTCCRTGGRCIMSGWEYSYTPATATATYQPISESTLNIQQDTKNNQTLKFNMENIVSSLNYGWVMRLRYAYSDYPRLTLYGANSILELPVLPFFIEIDNGEKTCNAFN